MCIFSDPICNNYTMLSNLCCPSRASRCRARPRSWRSSEVSHSRRYSTWSLLLTVNQCLMEASSSMFLVNSRWELVTFSITVLNVLSDWWRSSPWVLTNICVETHGTVLVHSTWRVQTCSAQHGGLDNIGTRVLLLDKLVTCLIVRVSWLYCVCFNPCLINLMSF